MLCYVVCWTVCVGACMCVRVCVCVYNNVRAFFARPCFNGVLMPRPYVGACTRSGGGQYGNGNGNGNGMPQRGNLDMSGSDAYLQRGRLSAQHRPDNDTGFQAKGRAYHNQGQGDQGHGYGQNNRDMYMQNQQNTQNRKRQRGSRSGQQQQQQQQQQLLFSPPIVHVHAQRQRQRQRQGMCYTCPPSPVCSQSAIS